MRILALETSAKAVSAAVTEDGKVLCSGYRTPASPTAAP